ncbi:Csu type fimbrial protein [Yersinia sp. Marseille-Q3913]|uniref:Csu type fimbrial protein n=1 Tax=Yersinia sp. Marseille-Q3913 TaxID=2830769 RepID=UPI00403FECE4
MIKEATMKKPLLIIGVMLLFQSVPSMVSAGTVTGTLGIKLEIIQGCYINDGTSAGGLSNLGIIDFSTVPTLNTRLTRAYSSTTSGVLNLYCSAGTAYSIGIDNGAHALSTQRRLAGGTSEFVSYNLYKDNGYSAAWGSTGSAALSGTATSISTAIPLTIYTEIPAQATPSVSVYTDTANVTVTW